MLALWYKLHTDAHTTEITTSYAIEVCAIESIVWERGGVQGSIQRIGYRFGDVTTFNTIEACTKIKTVYYDSVYTTILLYCFTFTTFHPTVYARYNRPYTPSAQSLLQPIHSINHKTATF